jgi:hypothetical protein
MTAIASIPHRFDSVTFEKNTQLQDTNSVVRFTRKDSVLRLVEKNEHRV